MSECNCVYEEFCKLVNGGGIILPKPCAYRKDSTDFVEVVRCKDCKHGNNFCARGKRKSTYCHRLGRQPVRMEQDDFCSYGERKGIG